MYFKVFSKKTGKCVSAIADVQRVELNPSVFNKGWIRFLIWCEHVEEPQTLHINPKTFYVQVAKGGKI